MLSSFFANIIAAPDKAMTATITDFELHLISSWVRLLSSDAAPAIPGLETCLQLPAGKDDNSPPPLCTAVDGHRRWLSESSLLGSRAAAWPGHRERGSPVRNSCFRWPPPPGRHMPLPSQV